MTTPAPVRASAAWRWIPTLYFAEGIPYVIVMTVSVVMYKNLHISNTDIALYTSWLYLPWVIKPLWSPLVDLLGTKRRWTYLLQLVIGAALACVALTVPTTHFFQMTLAVFWLMAFSSATHDIAADGFYMLAMPPHQQAAFVGVRSTFYRMATLTGQGGLVYLAGALQERYGSVTKAWSIVFWIIAGVFVVAGLYHSWALPRPETDRPDTTNRSFLSGFAAVFVEFFRRKEIGRILAFLLLYRFAEAQLLKLVTPFLLDARDVGGLGLTTKQVGIVYGTAGVIALTVGGIVGGIIISRYGLKRMLWPMIIIMHVPNLVFVLLAFTQPQNLWLIGAALSVEQFGYGFGFTAYMMYMILAAEGHHKTAHYAICTGFMALGMMLPGMAAGWIEDHLGYQKFFLYVCAATIPSFIAASLVRIDPAFGRKA
ncbi:AmpG family muropeptide MFS transporter [Opitutus sp. ER46]|uniref:AmpG family muropeptide MFS transporter n=1 Tax=Opitutus sp. ER46 TaxID=2161864 RepID=UPI000D31EDF5|nr:AmpG family muropeptide MFS transporter [Opitutus sp. ER46]PTX90995.1 MFS transporter [Opitutus sp. ER46]